MDSIKKYFIASIAFNVVVLLAFLSQYMGGWLFIAILYGIVMTGVAGWLILRSMALSNDYQDVIESMLGDTNMFIERLDKYLGPNSYLAYSEEVQVFIGAIKSFRNRLQLWVDAYENDDEELVPQPIERPTAPPNVPQEAVFPGIMNLPRRDPRVPTTFDQ